MRSDESAPTASDASDSGVVSARPLAEEAPITAGQVARLFSLLCVIVVLAGWGRVAMQSHAECARADSWLIQGDRESAIMAYRHAAEAWAPLSATTEALDALETIARDAREQGNTDAELMALRAMRSSILAVRTLWVPNGERLPAIHARIGELMALQVDDPTAADAYTLQLEQWRTRFPDRWLALLASALFFLWIISLPASVIWATPGAGGVNARRLLSGLAVSVVLLIGWLTAVYLA